jgi:hypothetical protein
MKKVKRTEQMPRLTVKLVEETLRKEVQKLDKRVQVVGVNQSKKKDAYRVTLLKDGRAGAAELKKDLLKEFLSHESKGNALGRALGRAVSRLNITYRK